MDNTTKACGFNTGGKTKECTEECRYFETYTRNPYKGAGVLRNAPGSRTETIN